MFHRKLHEVCDLQTGDSHHLSVVLLFAYIAVGQHYARIIRLQTRPGEKVLTADYPCHSTIQAHLRNMRPGRTTQSVTFFFTFPYSIATYAKYIIYRLLTASKVGVVR